MNNHIIPIQKVRIVGVDVHALTVSELHAVMHAAIRSQLRSLVLNANVHALNLAVHDRDFRAILNQAGIVFCDGAGVMLAAKLLGQSIPERITYADWIWQLAAFAAAEGHSLFLLGSAPGVAEAAAEALRRHAPGLRVAGTHHGYFDKSLGSAENTQVIEKINAARPDILLVSFGMPLQEYWLRDNWQALEVSVGLSAGAALDYASGNLRRGPRWMTDHGLEWLSRLIIEPRRLWRRYMLGNPVFLLRVLAQRFGLRRYD